jgi:hypothetical protein
LTFGIARGAAGVGIDGTSFFTGATGGGEGGFTADASSVFSGVAGGGTGAESGAETAAGGGERSSVPREHALSPSTTTAIREIRVNSISVTPLLQVVPGNH